MPGTSSMRSRERSAWIVIAGMPRTPASPSSKPIFSREARKGGRHKLRPPPLRIMGFKSERRLALSVSAGAVVALIVLALAVQAGATMAFDNTVRAIIHAQAGSTLTTVATGASFLGRLAVLIPATVLIAGG